MLSATTESFNGMVPPRPSWTVLDLPDEMPDSLRCAYASKRCENPRTIKKSGGLHRFCAFHRERANRNQWRVDHRRRLLKKCAIVDKPHTMTKAASDEAPRRGRSPRCVVDYEKAEVTSLTEPEARRLQDAELNDTSVVIDTYEVCRSREAKLNEQDIAILSELLFVENASTPIAFHTDSQPMWPAFPWPTNEERQTMVGGGTMDPSVELDPSSYMATV